MASAIDDTKPTAIDPLTADVRANETITKNEITALQAANASLANTITTFASADTTPAVTGGNQFETAGTTAITAFDGGVEGQFICILAKASITITNGAALNLSGAANYAMTVGDTLTLRADSAINWYEYSRSVN